MTLHKIHDIQWCHLMNKILHNNKVMSDYVLEHLKSNKVISSNSTLNNLHQNLTNKDMANYESSEKYKKTHKENYSSGINEVQKFLYNLDTDKTWYKMYLDLLKTLYKELGYDFYFQKTPTVRVHCPNAVGSEHYPMYHTDCSLGHPPQEVNVWLSLTNNENSGFFIMSLEDSMKYIENYSHDKLFQMGTNDKKGFNQDCHKLSKEVDSSLDYVYLFNSLRIHSGMPRQDDTRVSMDIRINPVDKFVHGYIGSGKQQAEYWPGGHFGYHEKSIKELI